MNTEARACRSLLITTEESMASKGYWIAHVDVTDAEAYKGYIAANAAAFRKFGGRFLVRAGKGETMEGSLRARTVVIEFKDYATALACYRSPEYAAALALRNGASIGDLQVIEGYDGVQPADG
jgi:uncharacterized protein (DUF1330 family)